jgi:hypothetical protein
LQQATHVDAQHKGAAAALLLLHVAVPCCCTPRSGCCSPTSTLRTHTHTIAAAVDAP